jgi:hypothetical protein
MTKENKRVLNWDKYKELDGCVATRTKNEE